MRHALQLGFARVATFVTVLFFLMLFYPERVALMGVLVYLTLWLLAPLKLVFPVSWESLGYIFLCYLAFFLGCLLMSGRRRQLVRDKQGQSQFGKRAFWWFVIIGAAGMAVRIVDKWFLRGAGLGSSALESRELLGDAAAGPLAALGGLLYPFCFVPLIIWWSRPTNSEKQPLAKWVAVTLFILPAIDALLLLSRSQMLVAFAMMYFAAACVLYRGRLLPKKLIFPVLLGIAGLLIVSITVFVTRLNEMNFDLAFSIQNSAYGYVITPDASAVQLMNQAGNFVGAALTSFMPMLQYYLHGLFEFGLLWDRVDNQMFTYGAQHFAPYLKGLSVFGISSKFSLANPNLYFRSGIFTTFFGPLWVDFAWLGPLFMLGFGLLSKYCAQRAREGFLGAMPLHVYFCVVVFFMPVVNFMISAQGMYIINALGIFWFFTRRNHIVEDGLSSVGSVHKCKVN